jgi:hypothetical protein
MDYLLMVKNKQNKTLLDKLCSLKEIDLQRKVIEPLLQADGFRNVSNVSGPYEKGRDLIAYKDDMGCNVLYVIQIKKLKLTANSSSDSNSVTTLTRQLEEAITEPVFDISTKSRRQPERLMFITPFPIERAILDANITKITRLSSLQIMVVDGYMLVNQVLEKIPNVARSLNDELAYQLSIIEKHKQVDESTAFSLDRPLDIRNIYVNADYDCFDRLSGTIQKFAKTKRSSFNSNLEEWLKSHSKNSYTNESMEVFQAHKTRWLNFPNKNKKTINIEAYCLCLIEYSIELIRKVGALNQKDCPPNVISDIITEVLEFQSVIKAIKDLTSIDKKLTLSLSLETKIDELNKKIISREGAISGKVIQYVNSSMLVTGGPGAGKTTLLRKLTISQVTSDSGQKPIFIRAIDIKGNYTEKDILDLAYSTVNNNGYNTSNQQFISDMKHGDFKLIIDGVDEAASNAKHVITSILKLNRQYSKSTIITSCREIFDWPDWSSSLHIRLNPFTHKQLIFL